MNIKDLDYCHDVDAHYQVLGKGGIWMAGTALAFGDETLTDLSLYTKTRELPHGGSLSIGRAKGKALASDPIDADTYLAFSAGIFEDVLLVAGGKTHELDKGTFAKSWGNAIVVGMTRPSR
ncbi:hypothetical protein C7271_14355 [filamentous cyanobacterium CCP5]|nr:hypothetical protein C7271_14355 [filamentous cyanobacterium CCP5]